MPFEALDAETMEFVSIDAFYPDPKPALADRTLICPVCHRKLAVRKAFVRDGHVVRPHFLHRLGAPDHPWTYAESPAHLAAKYALITWLRRDFFWADAKFIHTETPVRTHRRTDVMVTLPDGSRIAHEIQLSPLTRKAFLRRTRDYLTAGIPVFWWFDAARIGRAFRHTPVYLLQPTQLTLEFSYPDHAPAAHHSLTPDAVYFSILLNDRQPPETFRLAPQRPLPKNAAQLLWQSMLWAPLSGLLDTDTPLPLPTLFAALPAFWRARFRLADVARFLQRCRMLGLARQTPAGWRRIAPDAPAFLHPLFSFVDDFPSSELPPAVPDTPLPPSHCPYPQETPVRPLWLSVRNVLTAVDDWLTDADILARLPAPDRTEAETIALIQQTPLPELVRTALLVRWKTGEVVAGPAFTWRLQYLPDFDPADWQAKLAAYFSLANDAPDPWHDFSVRYHRWFWRQRGAAPADVRRMEFLPSVLTDPRL